MKFNLEFVLGIAYIVFMLGTTVQFIGQPTSCSTFSWTTVPSMFGAIATPFVLGYLAGRNP